MDTLPIELYGHICTFLGPSDLTNFARTSTACLGPARWHLYRNVVLRNDSPWLNEVCSLLEEVPGLKMRVTFLLVITVEDWAGSNDRIPWLHLNTFRGMKRLCSISFVHLPCKSPINLQKMMSGIYWECRELKQVSFSEISSDALPHYWSLPTTSMVYFAAFPKLEKVVYKSKPSSALNWDLFHPILFGDSSFLTHLNLSVGSRTSHFEVLRTLLLPRLHTLSVTGFPTSSSADFMSFLATHSSIRSLYVSQSEVNPHADSAKSILSNLHTISATPQFMSGLARKCDGLKYIHCLTLDLNGVSDVVHDVITLMSAVDGFPNLKHCSVNRIISTRVTAHVMRLFSATSTELEYWTGGFYYRNYPELNMIRNTASAFPELCRIDICEWTDSMDSVPKHQLRALQELASGLPKLRKICLYMPHSTSNEIVSIFNTTPAVGLSRRSGGVNLSKTYQLEEHGPHRKDRRAINFNSVNWEDVLVLEEGIVG